MNKQKTILILGGSTTVIPLVKRARERNMRVVLAHLIEDSPCAPYVDYHEKVNTLDIPLCIDIARKHSVDAVATIGADQPLYTASVIARELNLPSFVDVLVAKVATNKKEMRKCFEKSGIPVNKTVYITKDMSSSAIESLKLPIVIKPIDSHGSRGVYKLHSYDEAFEIIDTVLVSSFSRETECLVEEYYGDVELTLDGFMQDGKFHYLGIRKRNNLENNNKLGFCTSVISPCLEYKIKTDELLVLCQAVADSLGVSNGPLFMQIFDGPDGFRINEAAARVAGGHDFMVNKDLTGFDVIDAVLDGALGIRPVVCVKPFGFTRIFSSQMVIASHGVVSSITDIKEINQLPFIFFAEYYCKVGESLGQNEENFTKVAYVCIEGNSKSDLEQNVSSFYDIFKINDSNGANLVIRGSIHSLQL